MIIGPMSVSERRSSATPLESAGLVDAIPPIRYRCHGCGVAVDDSEDITLLLTAAASRSPERLRLLCAGNGGGAQMCPGAPPRPPRASSTGQETHLNCVEGVGLSKNGGPRSKVEPGTTS